MQKLSLDNVVRLSDIVPSDWIEQMAIGLLPNADIIGAIHSYNELLGFGDTSRQNIKFTTPNEADYQLDDIIKSLEKNIQFQPINAEEALSKFFESIGIQRNLIASSGSMACNNLLQKLVLKSNI